MTEKLTLKDFKDALYYMITKEPVPHYRSENINKSVSIIGLTGLVLLVCSPLIAISIKDGPVEALKTLNYGFNCASLNYGGNIPKR